jgi:hypothetical protein
MYALVRDSAAKNRVADPPDGRVNHLPALGARREAHAFPRSKHDLDLAIPSLDALDLVVEEPSAAFDDEAAFVKLQRAAIARERPFEGAELGVGIPFELEPQDLGALAPADLSAQEIADPLQTFISGTEPRATSDAPVAFWISSTLIPGARSLNTSPSFVTSITA